MDALRSLIVKEFRQIFRDPMMVRLIVFMPIIQLFVLGYAVSFDLKGVRLSVLDEDGSASSRRLAAAVLQTETFRPGPVAAHPREIEHLLVTGRTDIALHLPAGFQRDQERGRAVLGLTVDGRNSAQAGQALAQIQAILQLEARRASREATGRAPAGGIRLATLFLYNPELVSRFQMVPAIVVVLVTVISAMLTSMTVVREKELGTLEQLLVSPLTPLQLVLGKTLPLALLSFGELALATTVAVLWYQLPLAGSVPLLGGAFLLYLLVTLGGGLLASTVSGTQQQAMFTVWFFLVFAILLSGFFFPVANMPEALIWLTWLNPMRFIIEIVRGIFLKGSGAADLWPQLAMLALHGTAFFSLAIWRFRKRLA
ncbi:MAG: ABC transporter permease [bacterium]|jgi:ABC-2 type transport system permease protein|nr:ABC transporter permease [bacterium]